MKLTFNRRWLLGSLLVALLLVGAAMGVSSWMGRPDHLYASAQEYYQKGEEARNRGDRMAAQTAYESADQQLCRLLSDTKEPNHPGGLLLRYKVLQQLARLAAQEEEEHNDTSSDRKSLALLQTSVECAYTAAQDPACSEAQGIMLGAFFQIDEIAKAVPFATNLLEHQSDAKADGPFFYQYQTGAHYVLAWAALAQGTPPSPDEALTHLRACEELEKRQWTEKDPASRGPQPPLLWRVVGLQARALKIKADQEKPRTSTATAKKSPSRDLLHSKLTGWLERARREKDDPAGAKNLAALSPTNLRGLLDLLVLSVDEAADGREVVQRAELMLDVGEKLAVATRPSPIAIREVSRALGDLSSTIQRLPAARRPASEDLSRLTARLGALKKRVAEASVIPATAHLETTRQLRQEGRLDEAVTVLNKALAGLDPAKDATGEGGTARQRLVARLALHAEAAWILLVQGKTAEAEQHLLPLQQESKEYAAVSSLLQGLAAVRAGKLEQGTHDLHDAEKQLDPEQHLYLHLGLAEAYVGLGKPARALLYLEKLEKSMSRLDRLRPEERAIAGPRLASRNALYLEIVRCYLALDKPARADRYRAALAGKPEGLTASTLLANYRTAHGQEIASDAHPGGASAEFDAIRRDMMAGFKEVPEDPRLIEAEINWLVSLPELRRPNPPLPVTLAAVQADQLLDVLEMKPGSEAPLDQKPASLGKDEKLGLLYYLRGMQAQMTGNLPMAASSYAHALGHARFMTVAQRGLLGSLLALRLKESAAAAHDLACHLLQAHANDPALLLACAETALAQDKIQGERGMESSLRSLEGVLRQQRKGPAIGPYLLGRGWLLAGRLDLAQRDLNRALRATPLHRPSLLLAAQTALALEDWEACLQHAQALEIAQANPVEARRFKAAALLQRGDSAAARRVFRGLADEFPEQAAGYEGMASLLEGARDYADALAWVARWREHLPDDVNALQTQVRLLVRAGREEPARQAGERFLSDHGNQREDQLTVLLSVANGFSEARAHAEAERWGQRALHLAEEVPEAERGPGVVRAQLMLGDVYLAASREQTGAQHKAAVARAIDVFQEIWNTEPGHPIAGNNLAWLLEKERGDTTAALAIVQRVRQRRTGEELTSGRRLPLDFLDTAGTVYVNARQYDKAVTLFLEAAQRYQEEPRVFLHLGRAQGGLRQYAEATASLDRAARLAEEKAGRASDAERRAQLQAVATEARRERDGLKKAG